MKRRMIKNLDTGMIYRSCAAAAEAAGVSRAAVQRSCSGENRKQWVYFFPVAVCEDCKYYTGEGCRALKTLYCAEEGNRCWRYLPHDDAL